MNYNDGSRLTYSSEKIKSLLRPFPLVCVLILLMVLLHFLPEISAGLAEYIKDVEIPGAYKTLHYATIPLIILTVPLAAMYWKENKYYFAGIILFAFSFPWIIGFSIWLWELLGIIVVAIYLMICLGMFINVDDDEKENNNPTDWVCFGLFFLAGLGYLVIRLFSKHIAPMELCLIAAMYFLTLLKSIMIACKGFSFSTPFFVSLTFGGMLIYYLCF